MDVSVGPERRLRAEELMLLNCGIGEDSCESLGLQGDPNNMYIFGDVVTYTYRLDHTYCLS